MKHPKVWVFFYGSYINLNVLKEVDLVPEQVDVAKLSGYDIKIAPLANIIPSTEHCVYGIVAQCTHKELDRLYSYHAEKVLGGVYLPEAVMVQTKSGHWLPAMCYISHNMEEKQALNDYVERIANPAREFGFPKWYIKRIESFRSQ